jgi:hypothetical protein
MHLRPARMSKGLTQKGHVNMADPESRLFHRLADSSTLQL